MKFGVWLREDGLIRAPSVRMPPQIAYLTVLRVFGCVKRPLSLSILSAVGLSLPTVPRCWRAGWPADDRLQAETGLRGREGR